MSIVYQKRSTINGENTTDSATLYQLIGDFIRASTQIPALVNIKQRHDGCFLDACSCTAVSPDPAQRGTHPTTARGQTEVTDLCSRKESWVISVFSIQWYLWY